MSGLIVFTVDFQNNHVVGLEFRITKQTFLSWRNKFGGMDLPDSRRLKALASENAKFERLIAEKLPVIDGLKDFP
jgi:hypothetical protein